MTTESAEVSVEDWIMGVSFVQTTETIYRNPALWAEYEPIAAELDRVSAELDKLLEPVSESSVGGGESSLGDAPASAHSQGEASLGEGTTPEVQALQRRFAKLQRDAGEVSAKYEKDTEVWHLRQLDDEREVAPIVAEYQGMLPKEPRKLGTGATPAKLRAYDARLQAYGKELAKIALEVNLRCVALATLKVVVAGKEKPAPTVEQLRQLITRPNGQKHFRQLVSAVERISLQEVEIPVPHREGS